MKRIFTIISLFFILNSYSQKANVGDLGIGLDYKLERQVHIINPYVFYPDDSYGYDYDYRIENYNYFPALKFDYYLKKTISLNLFFRPSYINKTILNERLSPNAYLNEGKFQLFSMDVGLGAEKHFLREFKIDPFVGLNFHYLYSGQEKLYTKSISNFQERKYIRENTKTGVEVHGFYSTANFGMNYFLTQNFSVGINLDLGYRYSLQKGNSSKKIHNLDYEDGVLVSETNTEPTTKINVENKSFIYSFSLKAAFYLPITKSKK